MSVMVSITVIHWTLMMKLPVLIKYMITRKNVHPSTTLQVTLAKGFYRNSNHIEHKTVTLHLTRVGSGKKPLCQNEDILDPIFADDLISDCGQDADDEPLLKDILTSHNSYSCLEKYQIPCRQGHTKYFNISDICVYRLNAYHHLMPCCTGEHI